MTVKEMIEELQKYPPDMYVYVADSEYGDEESGGVVVKEVTHWTGPTSKKVEVVVIS